MEGEIDLPITAGAKYSDVDGEHVRVKSVWVDEDLTVQVQIFHERDPVECPKSKTVDLDSFVSRIGPTGLERVNSDHAAWEWRQD